MLRNPRSTEGQKLAAAIQQMVGKAHAILGENTLDQQITSRQVVDMLEHLEAMLIGARELEQLTVKKEYSVDDRKRITSVVEAIAKTIDQINCLEPRS